MCACVSGIVWVTFPMYWFYLYVIFCSKPANSTNDSAANPTEPNKTEDKFKERSTPKITFRSGSAGNEVAFKKRKLNPDKKRNIRQTNPNKID